MTIPDIYVGSNWEAGPALERYLGRKGTIGYILDHYFEPLLLYLFNNIVCHVDESVPDCRFLKLDIRAHGGTITNEAIQETTHIITNSAEKAQSYRLQFVDSAKRIVVCQWIKDCIKDNSLLNEDMYRPV